MHIKIVIHKLTWRYVFDINRKNDFAEISKNLVRYRSENNFIR